MAELVPAIRQAVAQAGQTVPSGASEQLAHYVTLLDRWNRAYNLSAVRDTSAMVPRHVIDSLSVRPWLPPGSLLDIGTGAGLPGLVVAIVEPERQVVLLDSGAKKVRFLRQAIIELGLNNATPIQARAADWTASEPFDGVVARAFGSLVELWRLARPLLSPAGTILAMKGQYPDDELAALPADELSCSVERLFVPGLDGERHLVRLKQVTS